MMSVGWVRRRWMEFRWGHSTYLASLLNFAEWVIIVYNMLIQKVSFLQTIFSGFHVFVVVFAIAYPPHGGTGRPLAQEETTDDRLITLNRAKSIRYGKL